MKSFRFAWLLLLVPLLAVPGLCYDYALNFYGPEGTFVSARLELETGGRFMVQQDGMKIEGYAVTFFACTKQGRWYERMLGLETQRWRDVELEHDEAKESIQVYSRGVLAAEYFMKRNSLKVYGHLGAGRWTRRLDSYAWMDPDYENLLNRSWLEE